MQLTYFELLSPNPVYIENIGSIISPKLYEILDIGLNTYRFYLSLLSIDLKSYFALTCKEKKYETIPDNDRLKLCGSYDLLIMNEQTTNLLQECLNFFIKENVIYSKDFNGFLITKTTSDSGKKEITGMINKDNFSLVCDAILKRNCIKTNDNEDLTNIKSNKALEILKKLQKGRAQNSRQAKYDANMELGNIISSVANRSRTLNIINIWELTIFQLWDCFARITNNNIYDIQAMSVAAWGNKDKNFDTADWYKKI